MQHIVYMRFAEHLVPYGVKHAFVPKIFPRKNPFREENDLHQAIFIHVPKTAGTSITRVLGGTSSRHFPLSRYAVYDPVRTARFFKFCFVRNPWDRLFSAYSYLTRSTTDTTSFELRWSRRNLAQYQDFDAFVHALNNPLVRLRVMSYIHFIPQYRWVTMPGRPALQIDHIGRFETLNTDFAAIMERLGLEASLNRVRVYEHPPYQNVYSAETREIVNRIYAQDIALFGYRFDGRSA
jgi:hypothetical protein